MSVTHRAMVTCGIYFLLHLRGNLLLPLIRMMFYNLLPRFPSLWLLVSGRLTLIPTPSDQTRTTKMASGRLAKLLSSSVTINRFTLLCSGQRSLAYCPHLRDRSLLWPLIRATPPVASEPVTKSGRFFVSGTERVFGSPSWFLFCSGSGLSLKRHSPEITEWPVGHSCLADMVRPR